MTENEVFEGIHKDCGKLEICDYKKTGCGDCLIRQTLIKAIQALEEIQAYRAIGTVEEFKALKEKSVAKKPTEWADGTKHCPNPDCEFDNTCLGFKVCVNCGQILDWN